MTVPQEAIDAALKKAAAETWTRISSRSVRELLEAAAPHIIAAAIEQNTEPGDGSMDFLKMAHAAGAAVERDRIAAAVTEIRDQARRLTQNMPAEIALGLNAQDEALTTVLDLIGETQ